MKKTLRILFSIGLLVSVSCSKKNFGLDDTKQEFIQGVSYNNKVDIVFMVDNSSSMSTYQGQLADQIPSVIATLNGMGLDYNIVVTTADMSNEAGAMGGYFIGTPKVIKSSTPDAVSVLQNRIRQGNLGSDTEKGIRSVMEILSPEYLAGAGAGFLRDDALLAVIFLSNEDDYSHRPSVSFDPMNPSDLIDHLNILKKPFPSGNKSWVANFLGILNLSSNCVSNQLGEYREPGLRYIEMVDASGGVKEDICNKTSLESAVKNVKVQILQMLSDFPLERLPVVSTLKVYINGNLIPQSNVDGWEYVASKNLIRFHGAYLPNANDKIFVDFSPAESK